MTDHSVEETVETSTTFEAEREFGDQVSGLSAREIVPGLLGEAEITNIERVEGYWEFVLEMPDSTLVQLRLSAKPESKTHELFAFLDGAGTHPDAVLDAQHKHVPVVLDGSQWKPVFPKTHTRVSQNAFRNVLWAAKRDLATTRLDGGETVLGLRDWPRLAYTAMLGFLLAVTVMVSGFVLLRFAPYLLILIVLGGLYVIQKGLRYSYTLFDTPLREVQEVRPAQE